MKLRESAERRPVTILHCDLVSSTQLVDTLDPEEFLCVVERYLNMCAKAVMEFHGEVAGFTGDGIEAYFGYPVTTETPAADALFAAIRIRNTLSANVLDLPVNLQCRFGIATGIAIVGQPESSVYGRRLVSFGSVAHLAERLQSVAKPDHILIDPVTREFASKYFTFGDIGDAQLKGFNEGVFISEVIDELNTASRFDYSVKHAVPVIGKDDVLSQVRKLWDASVKGKGQLVNLVGDVGSGKSRILYEFKSEIDLKTITKFRFQCHRQYMSSPLHPWWLQVQALANVLRTDTAEERSVKITEVLTQNLNFPERLLELTVEVFGLNDKGREKRIEESSVANTELVACVAEHLIQSAREKPMLIIIEDIQWADTATLAFLKLMLGLMADEPVFIGITSRRSCQVETKDSSVPVSTISLEQMNADDVREFINQLVSLEGSKLEAEAINDIVDRSDGNPLFVEELAAMHLEKAKRQSDGLVADSSEQVPLGLQMSLLSRVDSIKRGREITQFASVLHAPFTVKEMSCYVGREESVVSDIFDELVRSKIFRRMSKNNSEYFEFQHSLLKESVYSGLLDRRKQSIAQSIAECE